MIFSIDNREFPGLDIIGYTISLQTLDGEATGRSKATGWPMIRQPQGQITNLNLEFASTSSKNSDFAAMWRICKSMGSTEFVRVRFVDPLSEIIDQNMYIVASELKAKKIEQNGKVYTDSLRVSLIAEKGFMIAK